jgi:hypothetical protein
VGNWQGAAYVEIANRVAQQRSLREVGPQSTTGAGLTLLRKLSTGFRLIRSLRPIDVPGLQVAPDNISLQSLVVALITAALHASGCKLERFAVHEFGPLHRLGQRLFRFLLTGYVVCFDGIASREHDKAGH